MNNQKGMELLGLKAKDKVTGYEGVIESICYDLYGCVQACIRPTYTKNAKGEMVNAHWFDIGRLDVHGKPVMEVPDFAVAMVDHGPADKPRR